MNNCVSCGENHSWAAHAKKNNQYICYIKLKKETFFCLHFLHQKVPLLVHVQYQINIETTIQIVFKNNFFVKNCFFIKKVTVLVHLENTFWGIFPPVFGIVFGIYYLVFLLLFVPKSDRSWSMLWGKFFFGN